MDLHYEEKNDILSDIKFPYNGLNRGIILSSYMTQIKLAITVNALQLLPQEKYMFGSTN